jgi:hypothetical protein
VIQTGPGAGAFNLSTSFAGSAVPASTAPVIARDATTALVSWISPNGVVGLSSFTAGTSPNTASSVVVTLSGDVATGLGFVAGTNGLGLLYTRRRRRPR